MRIVLIATLLCLSANAVVTIEERQFVTRTEYYRLGKPCACPDDNAKNGRCGRRAAVCKDKGYNILDCVGKAIGSIKEYKEVQKELCGNHF